MAGPVTGQLGAFKQPPRWGRNESGNFEVYTFEGTPNEVRAMAATFALVPGLKYEVIEHFGKLTLEVYFPWNADGLVNPATDYVEVWEFFAQNHEKDLLESQDNAGIVATISIEQKQIIRNKINNPPQGGGTDPFVTEDTFTNTTDVPPVAIPGNHANAWTLYQLMQAGMRSYLMPAPVLRRTIVTSSQFALGYALLNVKKILSTGFLTASESMPAALLFNVAAFTGGDVSTDSLLAYGWYKCFPTIQQVALLKWQIVQEWQYGWWPVAVYGNPL